MAPVPRVQGKVHEGLSLPRRILQLFLFAAAAIYVVLIPFGQIPADARLGPVEAAILLIVLVFATGVFDRLEKFSISDKGVDLQLKQLHERQGELTAEVRALRFLFANFLPQPERGHLWGLHLDEPFPYRKSRWFETELRNLRAAGMIQAKPGVTVAGLPDEGDLKDFFVITDTGRWFLTQRQEFRDSQAQ